MPELPEVQLMADQLAAQLCGRSLRRIEVADPKIQLPVRRLAGQRVRSVRRRAKFIILELDRAQHLLVHLRMTGWFEFVRPPRYRLGLHTDGPSAWFVDSRRFGQVRCLSAAQLDQALAGLGPEPLDRHGNLERLQQCRRPLKVALLDQGIIAGVGNIYASEALWQARLDPQQRADQLKPAQRRSLHRSVVKVLRRALGWGEAVFENYACLAVYGRAGKACRRRCGGTIRRIVQQQRSTFYCPVCQAP